MLPVEIMQSPKGRLKLKPSIILVALVQFSVADLSVNGIDWLKCIENVILQDVPMSETAATFGDANGRHKCYGSQQVDPEVGQNHDGKYENRPLALCKIAYLRKIINYTINCIDITSSLSVQTVPVISQHTSNTT